MLDLGLPDLEGTEVCRRVRATSSVPIIVLSARGAEADKVNALDLGADDYVTKPFGPEELLARIRVALRRLKSEDRGSPAFRAAGPDHRLRSAPGPSQRHRDAIDTQGIRTGVAARPQSRPGADASRDPERGLGRNAVEQPEHLWTLIAQLRKKLEPDPANPRYLLSEPWVGYRAGQRGAGRRVQRDRPSQLIRSGPAGSATARQSILGTFSGTSWPLLRPEFLRDGMAFGIPHTVLRRLSGSRHPSRHHHACGSAAGLDALRHGGSAGAGGRARAARRPVRVATPPIRPP